MADPIDFIPAAARVAHWHASDASSVGDGNAVSAWADRIAAYSMAQGTGANQPIYRADYLSLGYEAVQFDGSNDSMSVTNAAFSMSGDFGFIVAFVFDSTWTSSGVKDTVINYHTSNSDLVRVRTSNATLQAHTAPGTTATLETAVAASSPYCGTFWGLRSGSIDFFIAQGETEGANGITYTTSATSTIYLGARGGIDQPFNGGIYEIIIFDPSACHIGDALKAASIMRDNWGITKYQITPTLPSSGITVARGMHGGMRG